MKRLKAISDINELVFPQKYNIRHLIKKPWQFHKHHEKDITKNNKELGNRTQAKNEICKLLMKSIKTKIFFRS